MKIVKTEEVSFSRSSRTGFSSMLLGHLERLEPGQTLLVDVDYALVDDLDDGEMDDFAKENEIKVKAHEETIAAISRWIASKQRTRIMAALGSSGLSKKHYFHTRLVTPDAHGLIREIAVICDDIALKPKRAGRQSKKKAG